MHSNGDVLGEEGRKALDACVKVRIYGKPENLRRYDRQTALDLLQDCYAGGDPIGSWLDESELLLSNKLGEEKTWDIIEIHDELEKFENMPYVEKYPKPEAPRYKEMKELIDKRRIDVDREFEEAIADPDAQHKYSWFVAQRRVRDCFAGNFAGDFSGLLGFKRSWDNEYERYSIIDIYDAVVLYNEPSFVPNYPDIFGGFSEFEIYAYDERRRAIAKEYEQALSSPDNNRKEYTRDEAERRVQGCYFRPIPEGVGILPMKNDGNGLPINTLSFTIFDIYKAIEYCDKKKHLEKYPEDGGPGSGKLKKLLEENIAAVRKECEKVKLKLRRYSPYEAEQRVRDCFEDNLVEEATIFPVKNIEIGVQDFNQTYDIFDIKKVYCHFKTKNMFFMNKRPQCVGSWEVIESVIAKRDALEKEYKQSKSRLDGCSRREAERRVRDCFASAFCNDVDVFSTTQEEVGIPNTQQTYDIFDIKKAVGCFDLKTLHKKYQDEKYPESEKVNSQVDEIRGKIKEEYEEATEKVEIDHGSGFIIHEHFIITNKHVIEDALCDNTKEIRISNAATCIGELSCEVAHYDAGKDLALLYCRQLNLKQNGISPLQLSNHSLLPGMQIFAFGFPMSHTEETALFVNGSVSGSKKTYSGHTMTVLNCALNSGNSGGPILCWVIGKLKVVGVATQKHFKEILTLEEIGEIEKIRKALQTSSIAMSKYLEWYQQTESYGTKMNLLTLKLYDALETHSQFNLSNAVPGCCVIDFIKESISKYKGEAKEELAEVVKWSEDHSSVLPVGHHSSSKCCVQ